jgi:hypothetical protein
MQYTDNQLQLPLMQVLNIIKPSLKDTLEIGKNAEHSLTTRLLLLVMVKLGKIKLTSS